MILDTLAHASLYSPLGPRFARGLAWLGQFDPATSDGRYEIDGDSVYALVQSYATVPAAGKRFESHLKYADIQYIVRGSEVIGYAPVGELKPETAYDATKDFRLYADPVASTPLHCAPGTFAIFYPQDGHKPGCTEGRGAEVKKVVVKVLL